MIFKRFLNLFFVLVLVASTLATPIPVLAQSAIPTAATQIELTQSDLDARLALIEKTLEAKRIEYGIPGASLVIVKGDQIIYMKGLGYKNLERKTEVTVDTLFAIGSSSKAFTALTVLMSADEGKLSLDDSPRKYLPYFKLYDPEADAKITIRDLLSHSSGLNRTDLAFAIGTLNREEVIRVAGMAHPTAKLREKFQYQNLMYTVAGEVAASAQKSTWEKLIRQRIFKPLGMTGSNVTVKEMMNTMDYSLGYTYNTDTKTNRRVPMRDIPSAAPAGAINSSARDMAEWLRFLIAGGVHKGKRLISEKSFTEFTSPQMKIGGKTSYGLGWFLRDWKGHKVVEHGGNIDGFNAQVAYMPDQKLGFALLTNVTASPLGSNAMEAIWTNLVNDPSLVPATTVTAAPIDRPSSVGTYSFAEAKVNVEVELENDKLVMTVPGQPKYTLENVGGNRYKLIYPGLEGFFTTFRVIKDKPGELEMFVEQPGASYVLPKIKAAVKPKQATTAGEYDGAYKELIGNYLLEGGKMPVEIKAKDGMVWLVAPGQQPYALVEKTKDEFSLSPLPEATYKLNVKRDEKGVVTAIVSTQPEGAFIFNRVAAFAPSLSVDELMKKVLEAAGGESLLKHSSMVTRIQIDLIHQGLTGEGTIVAKSPNMQATDVTFLAFGKKIGSTFDYFDGTTGGQETSFTPSEITTGKQLANTRINSDFYGLANWKKLYKAAEIKRMGKVGEEEAYVVVLTPSEGTPITLYVSTKSFLVLRKDSVIPTNDTSGIELPMNEEYSDYKSFGGMMLPAKTITHTLPYGDIITTIKDVQFDVAIPDKAFKPRAKM